MSYALYLAGSTAGVGLMVALCYLLFGVRREAIASREAISRLRAEVAGFVPGDIAMDIHGAVALVENRRDGSLHLVVIRGDGLVARRLVPRYLKSFDRANATLALRLSDFTLPEVSLALADAQTASQWQARLARCAA